MIGNKEQLDNVPQSSVDQAVAQLNRVLKPGSVVHSGIYTGDRDTLTVFTAVGGLGKPKAMLEDLS